MQEVDLNRYSQFVEGVTSGASNDLTTFMNRLDDVDQSDAFINVPLALTASIGLAGETGEFAEIIKKIMFHGKPYNEELRAHMAKELGDIIWYWTNACRALDLDPNQVIADNVAKLEARYPGGKFDVFHSENRKEGDI